MVHASHQHGVSAGSLRMVQAKIFCKVAPVGSSKDKLVLILCTRWHISSGTLGSEEEMLVYVVYKVA